MRGKPWRALAVVVFVIGCAGIAAQPPREDPTAGVAAGPVPAGVGGGALFAGGWMPVSPPSSVGARHAVPLPTAHQTVTVDAVAPTLLVAGFDNLVADKKWRDFRLGMGLVGRLAEGLTVEGDFVLLESRGLAASVREAAGGRWVSEAPVPLDVAALFDASGADWIASGTFEKMAVTRDRVTGLVSARRFLYRAEVSLCLLPARGRELCARGSGESKTTTIGALIEYRGSEVAFDQAGPAQALDRALADAAGRLLVDWRRAHPAPSPPVQPVGPATEPLPIYVASFDVAPSALERWPALRAAGVGLGLAQRIADAVYGSGRFQLLEEKAEVVARLATGLDGSVPPADEVLPEADWLLYGEINEVTVTAHEKAFSKSTDETRVSVQLRLVERATRRVRLATGVGAATSPGTRLGAHNNQLDPAAVAEATGRAVTAAAEELR
jgi:hypothetical protein